MVKFCRIRHLKIDFGIFAAIPTWCWNEFPVLNKLSVVLHLYHALTEVKSIDDFKHTFVKLQQGSKYGNRTDWVSEEISTALKMMRDEHASAWKFPSWRLYFERINQPRRIRKDCRRTWTSSGTMTTRIVKAEAGKERHIVSKQIRSGT